MTTKERILDLLFWVEKDHKEREEILSKDPSWDGDLWDSSLLKALADAGFPYNDNTTYYQMCHMLEMALSHDEVCSGCGHSMAGRTHGNGVCCVEA